MMTIFYRISSVRIEELKLMSYNSNSTYFEFPEYFDVCFVEHRINLSKYVWNSLKTSRTH